MKNKIMFQGKPMSIRRLVIYVIGLWVMALGIAFAVNSDFGVSPVTTLPYVCGRILGISVGTGTMVAYTAYILIELLIYRKEFKIIYVLQFPAAIMFGYFTDMCKALISPLGTPQTIILKVVFVVVGVILLGAGLCAYLEAGVGTMLNFWSKVFRSQLKVFLYGKPEEEKLDIKAAAAEK